MNLLNEKLFKELFDFRVKNPDHNVIHYHNVSVLFHFGTHCSYICIKKSAVRLFYGAKLILRSFFDLTII